MIPKALLDIVRWLLIIAATAYVMVLIWRWSWIAAIIALVPVYIVLLNVFGFAPALRIHPRGEASPRS